MEKDAEGMTLSRDELRDAGREEEASDELISYLSGQKRRAMNMNEEDLTEHNKKKISQTDPCCSTRA